MVIMTTPIKIEFFHAIPFAGFVEVCYRVEPNHYPIKKLIPYTMGEIVNMTKLEIVNIARSLHN